MLTITNTETILHPQGKASSKQPYVFWVTEVTNPCLRSAFLNRKLRKPPSSDMQRNFELGRLVEKRWIELLRESRDVTPLSVGAPCRHINHFFEVHGKADLIAQHALGVVVLYEVKATKGKALTLGDPYRSHVDQLQFYLNAIGIERGIINYIDHEEFNRSGQLIDREYPINREEKKYLAILNRSHDLFEALHTDTIPSKEPCWKCNGYCQYEDECRGRYQE